jgi:hypothetical protein
MVLDAMKTPACDHSIRVDAAEAKKCVETTGEIRKTVPPVLTPPAADA